MTELCPHLTGEHKTFIYLALIAAFTICAVVGACTYDDFKENQAYRDAGYCQTMVVGYTSPVWRKCP